MAMELLRPSESVAVMLLTITEAALWQQEAIDQMRPMNDAIDLAGTAHGSWLTLALSLFLAVQIFSARELVTLNLNG